jgi:hypothetical protein
MDGNARPEQAWPNPQKKKKMDGETINVYRNFECMCLDIKPFGRRRIIWICNRIICEVEWAELGQWSRCPDVSIFGL